ncbi:MAG TPA: hypothetical protein VGJ87_27610 [Roseiflexaceae bacterium]|jgi:hypothetical protein
MEAAEVTRTGTIWLDADGILRVRALPGVEDTLDDAKQNIVVCAKLVAGKRRPVLIDMRALKTQSREVRSYYTGPEAMNLNLAIAILVDSPMSRVIGNFFLGFSKTDWPTKLFKSEVEALAWLQGFLG